MKPFHFTPFTWRHFRATSLRQIYKMGGRWVEYPIRSFGTQARELFLTGLRNTHPGRPRERLAAERMRTHYRYQDGLSTRNFARFRGLQ